MCRNKREAVWGAWKLLGVVAVLLFFSNCVSVGSRMRLQRNLEGALRSVEIVASRLDQSVIDWSLNADNTLLAVRTDSFNATRDDLPPTGTLTLMRLGGDEVSTISDDVLAWCWASARDAVWYVHETGLVVVVTIDAEGQIVSRQPVTSKLLRPYRIAAVDTASATVLATDNSFRSLIVSIVGEEISVAPRTDQMPDGLFYLEQLPDLGWVVIWERESAGEKELRWKGQTLFTSSQRLPIEPSTAIIGTFANADEVLVVLQDLIRGALRFVIIGSSGGIRADLKPKDECDMDAIDVMRRVRLVGHFSIESDWVVIASERRGSTGRLPHVYSIDARRVECFFY